MSNKLKTWILIIALAVVGGKTIIPRLFDPSIYRGPWYKVTVPEGWEKKKKEDEIIFLSANKDFYTEKPEAMFSIYGKRAKGALFIDDLFIEVKEALGREPGDIMDEGEIKIDGHVAKWILFHYERPSLFILTFYMVDEFNRFTKIQFITHPKNFDKYRPAFEKFKESIKFKAIF